MRKLKTLTQCPECGCKRLRVLGGLSHFYFNLKPRWKIKAECSFVHCQQPLWINPSGLITRRKV